MTTRQMLLPLGDPPRHFVRGALSFRGVFIETDISEEPSGIPDALREAGAQALSRSLPAGDYLVGRQVLVERKSAGDFTRSLYDGRLARQLAYLRRSALPCLMVVEGAPGYFERLWPPRLRSALLAAVMGLRVPVLFTRSPQGTAELLLRLGRRCLRTTSGEFFMPARPGRGPRPGSALLLFHSRLTRLPGIGSMLALRLMGHFRTLKILRLADEKALQRVPGVGLRRACKIRDALAAANGATSRES